MALDWRLGKASKQKANRYQQHGLYSIYTDSYIMYHYAAAQARYLHGPAWFNETILFTLPGGLCVRTDVRCWCSHAQAREWYINLPLVPSVLMTQPLGSHHRNICARKRPSASAPPSREIQPHLLKTVLITQSCRLCRERCFLLFR